MTGPRRLPILPAAIAATLALVAFLGVVQYRWAGELSEAERTRLRSAAKASADAFSRDFDLEITRAYAQLELPAGTLQSRDFSSWSERFEAWRRSSAFPDLVADVYLVERAGKEATVSRYVPQARGFEPASWPPALEALRARALAPLEPPPPGGTRGGRRNPFDPILDEVPALVAPVFDRSQPGPPPAGERRTPSLMVAMLDGAVLRDKVLPAVAARSFGRGGEGSYDLVVVSQRDPKTVVWRSSAEAAATARPDAAAGLFDLRFEDVHNGQRTPPFPGRRAYTEDTGRWRLAVSRHQAPLDDLVEAARRRNLAVSLGTLGLLLASMTLVVITSQRAQRLGERQMHFVSAVSHELRTPVAVICSTAENLADGVVRDPAQVRLYGSVVRDEGRRLGRMVEQILTFAGAGADQPIPREPVAVGSLVARALAALQPTLSAGGFAVEATVAPGLPDVQGDPEALQHALQNLIENAVKYDRGERWIGVAASLSEDRAWVRVSVQDHGAGIAPAELRHVFDPFFRGSDARASQARGFGLGLALVQRVAVKHGGRVTEASLAGEGSTFTLELPAAAALPARAPEAARGANPSR